MEIKWDWVDAQLEKSKTPQPLATSVKRLLETLETMNLATDDSLREIIDKFQKLALGHTIAAPEKPGKWEPVVPGDYRIGDTVRVRPDAYEGTKGTIHNDRRGRVTGAHGYLATVVYEGETNSENQFMHKLEKLERLVK